MKLKNALLSLSLAGFCFSQASAQDIPHSQPAKRSVPPVAAARHIGDGVKSIGDTNRFVESGPDVRPDEFKPQEQLAVRPASMAQTLDSRILAPTASRSTGSPTGSRTWFSAETLLWFSDSQNAPPLVTTSDPGVFPIAGAPGVTTQFGGQDGIPTGLLPGYRLDGGFFLGSQQKVAIGGRVFGIYSDAEKYSITSNGSTNVGIPYFNAFAGVLDEDAYLVAASDVAGNVLFTGTADARADLDMIGADASIYMLLSRSSGHRVDLLGGYTFNRLKSSVSLATQSAAQNFPFGNLVTNDLFATENNFHGGHLGVLSSVVKSKISFSSLAKISFGNVQQTGSIEGFTVATDAGGNSNTTPGGIFTQPSNIGTYEQNAFAFMPEIGMKLGYHVCDSLQFTVGYTFLYWSSVAMAGDQIDRTVDLTQGTPRPQPLNAETGFWMQGIDLGLTFTY